MPSVYLITSPLFPGRVFARVPADSKHAALQAFMDIRALTGELREDGACQLALVCSGGMAYYASR